MNKWQYYTPEGMNDLLPETTKDKRVIEERLRSLFNSFSYQEISTPGLEFYDVYAAGALAPQEALFKLCDEQSRVLALRFDGTVPALRMAATKFSPEAFPLRLSYIQNMFRFNECGGGRQRAFTQAGVELLGLEGAEADAEIIALSIMACQVLGLNEMQISLGTVAFTKALFHAWELKQEEAEQLSELIDSRNMLGAESFARNIGLDEQEIQIIRRYFEQPMTLEELEGMDFELLPNEACAALEALRQVLELLASWGYADYLSIDLSLLQSMNYYTGLTFKAFTYDLGFALLSGGRYDQAAATFGQNIKATGFSMGVDLALMALRRQGKRFPREEKKVLLAAAPGKASELWPKASVLRQQAYVTEFCYDVNELETFRDFAKRRKVFALAFIDSNKELLFEKIEEEVML